MIPVGDEKLPVQRIAEARDAIWARALREFQNGLQMWSTDEEMDRILTRNSDYDLVDPWSDLIGDWLKRQGTAAYVQRQQIYDFLEIGPERQNNFNAQRIRELRPITDGSTTNAASAPASGSGPYGTRVARTNNTSPYSLSPIHPVLDFWVLGVTT